MANYTSFDNFFRTDLGVFLRFLQRERDMSALYVSSIGPETKGFLLRRYPDTDTALDNMSSWPVRPGKNKSKSKRSNSVYANATTPTEKSKKQRNNKK